MAAVRSAEGPGPPPRREPTTPRRRARRARSWTKSYAPQEPPARVGRPRRLSLWPMPPATFCCHRRTLAINLRKMPLATRKTIVRDAPTDSGVSVGERGGASARKAARPIRPSHLIRWLRSANRATCRRLRSANRATCRWLRSANRATAGAIVAFSRWVRSGIATGVEDRVAGLSTCQRAISARKPKVCSSSSGMKRISSRNSHDDGG